jgi:ribonucleoside-diphosphate reductase beta chain
MFFFAAFAYVYFLRSKDCFTDSPRERTGCFRDESAHMNFALEVVKKVRNEEPELFDDQLTRDIVTMLDEAVDCEMQFAEDILSGGVAGLSVVDMRQYLEFIADQRLTMLGLQKVYGAKNPFSFMDLQDVQELANFFERACPPIRSLLRVK